MRLDQFLSNMGEGSRSAVKKLIDAGRVSVDGHCVRSPKEKIVPGKSLISVDNRPVIYEKNVYYMLHKPAGYVCATKDRAEKTVMELVDCGGRDLFPAGRLDKDTEGFVLLTDDGAFAHRILSPKSHVPKTYFVIADGALSCEDTARCLSGIDIGEDRPMMPARLEILHSGFPSTALLTISEGKFHQVKRMFHFLQKPVIYLKRIAIGDVYLDLSLKKGEYRAMTKKEIEQIEKSSGKHERHHI